MLTNTKIPTIIISILLGLFLAAAWYGYKQLATIIIDPMQAFPKNTAFIIEIPEPKVFFEKLNDENGFWLDLLSNPKTNELSKFINDLISQSKGDEKLKLFFNQPFYLSVVKIAENKSDFLLVTKQNGLRIESLNTKLFSKLKDFNYTESKNDSAFAKIQTKTASYFLAQNKGLFFISSNSQPIQDALSRLLEKKEIVESADFNQLKKTRGMRADAYLYVAYASTNEILNNQLNTIGTSLLKTTSFANYSVLDVILKKDELLLNGYTSAYDSLNQYLSVFQNLN